MRSYTSENQINLAIKAILTTLHLSIRRVVKLYSVPMSTLAYRIRGWDVKPDCYNARANLIKTEEKVIVQYILDQDSRGFSLQFIDIVDIANLLLAKRDALPIGKNWPNRLVARYLELKTRLNRVYDYQRALCEDFVIIELWFRLMANIRAKYGILDCNYDYCSRVVDVLS